LAGAQALLKLPALPPIGNWDSFFYLYLGFWECTKFKDKLNVKVTGVQVLQHDRNTRHFEQKKSTPEGVLLSISEGWRLLGGTKGDNHLPIV